MSRMGSMHWTLLRAYLVVVVVFPTIDLPVFALFLLSEPAHPNGQVHLHSLLAGNIGRHGICFGGNGNAITCMVPSDVECLDVWYLCAVRTRGRLWTVGDHIDTMTMEVQGTKTTLGRS
jgi:hypothetical protein